MSSGKRADAPEPTVSAAPARSWRDELTVDDVATIERAREYRKFWDGVPNSNVLILVAKLVDLLDGQDGSK